MELIIFVGLPGSGKTSFYEEHYKATHRHVSKDLLPKSSNKKKRQDLLLKTYLEQNESIVVDNTNPTVEERARIIQLGKLFGARIVGYFFQASVGECIARNERRQGKKRVPKVAIYTAAKKLKPPTYEEGFDQLYIVQAGENQTFRVVPQ